MGILINDKYIWQAGDIVYCNYDELIHGPFIIHKALETGDYIGQFVGGMVPDFDTTYLVGPEDLKPYSAITLLPE